MTSIQITMIVLLALHFVQCVGAAIRWVRLDPNSTAANFIAILLNFSQLGGVIFCLVAGGFFN